MNENGNKLMIFRQIHGLGNGEKAKIKLAGQRVITLAAGKRL